MKQINWIKNWYLPHPFAYSKLSYSFSVIYSLTKFRSNGNRLKCRTYCLQNCQKDFIFFLQQFRRQHLQNYDDCIKLPVWTQNMRHFLNNIASQFYFSVTQYINSWSFLLFYSFIIDLIIFNEILWDSINQLCYSTYSKSKLFVWDRENLYIALFFLWFLQKNYTFLSFLNKVLEKLEETSQEHKCQTSYKIVNRNLNNFFVKDLILFFFIQYIMPLAQT